MNVFFLVFHLFFAFLIALRVIYSRRSTSAATAWLAVLFAFPLLGVLAYLLIGEPKLGRQRGSRLAEVLGFYRHAGRLMPAGRSAAAAVADERFRQLAVFADKSDGMPVTAGNRVQLLSSTDEIIDAFLADIRAARYCCLMQFYIVDGQGRAAEVLDALADAARRGVRCRLLADALGSRTFWESAWPQRLRDAGVKVCQSLPAGLLKSLWVRSDLRNHRKILVTDYQAAYTGSYNLVDPAFFKQNAGVGEWVDAVMRVEGAAARQLTAVFYADWAVENDAQLHETLQRLNRYLEESPVSETDEADSGGALLQAVTSQPGGDSYPLYDMLVCALHNARRKIVMTTPYFVPDDALTDAMTTAAGRGVQVVLLVPEKVDSLAVRYAGATYYRPLLEAGVEVRRFTAGLLHTKSVLIDDAFALFGTVNMDMRSFYLNLEVSLAVYDAATVAQIARLQQHYLADSRPMPLRRWQEKNGVLGRFAERVARLASPLL